MIWVIDVETGQREELTAPYMSLSGIGPVWSPDGQTIAYQRSITMDTERAEVVLVRPGDRSQQTREANEVVMPNELVTTDGTSLTVYPLRVSWSPDGAYLLYVARAYPDGNPEEKWVVAVPTDPGAPAVGLATGAASSAMGVASQVWQRR